MRRLEDFLSRLMTLGGLWLTALLLMGFLQAPALPLTSGGGEYLAVHAPGISAAPVLKPFVGKAAKPDPRARLLDAADLRGGEGPRHQPAASPLRAASFALGQSQPAPQGWQARAPPYPRSHS